MKYDLVVVGAGILGSSISYFATENGLKVALVERENEPGLHSTFRNTGVIHRPFYLNPLKRKASALAASRSYEFFKKFAEERSLFWNPVGTLEVALDEKGEEAVESYKAWAVENGMEESEFEVLDRNEIKKIEPNVKAPKGFWSKTDAVVNFKQFSDAFVLHSKSKGADLYFGCSAKRIEAEGKVYCISGEKEIELEGKAVVSAAGAESFRFAQLNGLKGYAQLHFRGDYWRLSEEKGSLFRRNIYTVPRFTNFPFLDPHIVKRHTGGTEVGPNAFLVPGPYDYEGFISKIVKNLKGTGEGPLGLKLRLVLNGELIKLIVSDWSVSLFKSSLIRRLSKFVEGIKSSDVIGRGISGIRHNLISKEGFVQEPLFYIKDRALFVLNYNSPGATGSPWYASVILAVLSKKFGLKAEEKLLLKDSSEANLIKIIEK